MEWEVLCSIVTHDAIELPLQHENKRKITSPPPRNPRLLNTSFIGATSSFSAMNSYTIPKVGNPSPAKKGDPTSPLSLAPVAVVGCYRSMEIFFERQFRTLPREIGIHNGGDISRAMVGAIEGAGITYEELFRRYLEVRGKERLLSCNTEINDGCCL